MIFENINLHKQQKQLQKKKRGHNFDINILKPLKDIQISKTKVTPKNREL